MLDKLNRFIEISKDFGTDVCRPSSDLYLQVLEDLIGPLSNINAKVKYTKKETKTYPSGLVVDEYTISKKVLGGTRSSSVQNINCTILKEFDNTYLIYYSTYKDEDVYGEMKDLYIVDKELIEV